MTKTKPKLPAELRRTKPVSSFSIVVPQKPSEASRSAWARFLEKVEETKAELGVRENEESWFRGQKEGDVLTASLYRLLRHGFTENENDPKSIYEIEYDLFFESASRGPGLQDPGLNSWDILAHMRHHGLPTRLLDWTERLGVAVFFALENCEATGPRAPVVWVLNPYLLNEVGLGDRDLYAPKYLGESEAADEYLSYEDFLIYRSGKFDWELPVAIYPPQKNARMRSQIGWFTIWGEDSRDLDAQCPDCVKRISIDPAALPAALGFLADAGIDYSTIYPDLDGFARMLKARYNLNPPSKADFKPTDSASRSSSNGGM